MRLCKHCCKSDSVQLSSELQPFLRVRPCNPVPPSNHQSSRHTSSRPDARTQPPPFSDHRAPPPNNNQPWENYTHAPVLYPLTSSLIADCWWHPTQRGVSRPSLALRSQAGPNLEAALPRQRPHNSLARSYRPRHAPSFLL